MSTPDSILRRIRMRDGPNTTRTFDDFNTGPGRSNAVNGFQRGSTCLNIRRWTHPADVASPTIQPCLQQRQAGVSLEWSDAGEACLYASSCISLLNRCSPSNKLLRLPFFPSISQSPTQSFYIVSICLLNVLIDLLRTYHTWLLLYSLLCTSYSSCQISKITSSPLQAT